MKKEDLSKLRNEFPFHWRVQSYSKYKAQAILVPYADSRQVQDVLDTVCGPEGWRDEYYEVGGNTYCKIGICVDDVWVEKSDCGKESDIEKEKGQASDAFKRAAIKWGIGRFLYSMRPYTLPANKKKEQNSERSGIHLWCVDKKGNKLQDWQLNDYVNGMRGTRHPIPAANENAVGDEKTGELGEIEAWSKKRSIQNVMAALEILGHKLSAPDYRREGLASLPRAEYTTFCHLVQISAFDGELVDMCVEGLGFADIAEVVKKKQTEKLYDECRAVKKHETAI